MDYLFLKNRNFDVDGTIERFAGKTDLYEKYITAKLSAVKRKINLKYSKLHIRFFPLKNSSIQLKMVFLRPFCELHAYEEDFQRV